MILLLMRMKYEWMVIGFRWRYMLFFIIVYKLQNGLQQTTLHNG